MSRLIKKSSKTKGLPPGTLVHVGDKKTAPVEINVIDYTSEKLDEYMCKNVEECFSCKKKIVFHGLMLMASMI